MRDCEERARYERLNRKVRVKDEEMKRLQHNLARLNAKGFTVETLERIVNVEAWCGGEVLLRVQTAAKYLELKEELSRLRRGKADLTSKVQDLEKKSEEMMGLIRSLKNEFDQLQVETVVFKDAVNIAKSFFEAGYGTEELEGLKRGIDVLGIRNNPKASISRLANGLAKMKKLIKLENRITEVRRKLDALNKARTQAESELKVAENVTLSTIEKARIAAVHSISDCAEKGNASINSVVSQFQKELQGTMTLHEQKTRLQEMIGPGLALLGILDSMEYLKAVPVPIVVRLFERLRIWIELNMPHARARPSQRIYGKDANLFPSLTYRMAALVEFTCEGLNDIMMDQLRQT